MLILEIIDWILNLFIIALIVRSVLSFIPNVSNSGGYRLFNGITEPVLAPIRNVLNRTNFGAGGSVDFSPVFALLLVYFVKNIIRVISF